MKAHGWCCVLGLLCVPAGVLLSTSPVSQDPASISLTSVNSSARITCSTSRSDPLGLTLYRGFPSKSMIVFLVLDGGLVAKNTPASEFAGRLHVAPHQRTGQAHGFTFQMSVLGLGDTNLYYCSWNFYNVATLSSETLFTTGTVIIVRERDPQEQCREHILDLVLITLSVTAFVMVVGLCVTVLIVKYKRFKKSFRPARAAKPRSPNRPPHVCLQQRVRHYPYLITSVASLDYRGIL
ncbi:uncharacterized protein [Clinocottus analis]|uniref:uncharacterized protein n=1 Tax=Clinocottus analis TaxID=304258 RepID=UPI0035C15B1D